MSVSQQSAKSLHEINDLTVCFATLIYLNVYSSYEFINFNNNAMEYTSQFLHAKMLTFGVTELELYSINFNFKRMNKWNMLKKKFEFIESITNNFSWYSLNAQNSCAYEQYVFL